MTHAFRACISPSQKTVHIRLDPRVNSLVLCERTSIVRDVDGVVSHSLLCIACIKCMAEYVKQDKLAGNPVMKCDSPDALAVALGLERIV